MATKALVLDAGTTQRVPDAETLVVGVGIDAATATTLTIGGTTATSITIGSAAITTDFPGPVQLTGDVTTVGGTTFTSDATFEGNVTFGNGPADTVTFAATTTVVSDINFGGSATYKITNLADPTASSQEAATAAWVEAQIAAIPPTTPGAPADSIQFNDGAGGFAGSASLTWSGTSLDVTGAVNISGGDPRALVIKDITDATEILFFDAAVEALTVQSSVASSVTTIDAAQVNISDAGHTAQLSVGAGSSVKLDLYVPVASAVVPSIVAADGAAAPVSLKLDASQIDVNSVKIVNLANGTASTDAVNLSQLNAVAAIEYDQQIFVSDGADPLVATGAPLRPFASISAAMAAITDASPTKRYAISVAAGEYTEASALNLKPNVFIVGVGRDAVRITAPSYGLDASFTGGADNRSGISNAIVTGAASFDFTTVTSTAGKLYFRDTTFVSAVTLTGYNNAIVQAQISGCQIFDVFTVQGVNVGVFNDNICWSDIVLTQSPFGGVPTILTATGGACSGTVTATTTVNDFNRRISIFARSFWMNGAVTIDGPSSYLDYTVDSLPSGGASTPNGGNLVSIDYGANKALSNLVYPTAVNNPIIPATSSATNMGDWDKQWFFSFSYVYLSTGTDLYIGSAGASATPDSAGRAVFLQPDQYGIDVNVNGGVLDLRTANATGTGISGNVDILTGTSVNGNSGDITLTTGAPSGTGTRGVISLNGREIDANSVKIVNVADGVNPNDAVNFSQLSAIVSGVSAVTATAPLLSSGGAAPDISIDTAGANSGDVLTYNGAAWAAAAPVLTPPGGAVDNVQLNDGAGGFAGSASLSFSASTLTVQSTVAVTDGSETLSLTKDSASTDAATFDIEAASSVTATITGGASFLLTPNSIDALTYAASVAIDLDPSLPPLKSVALTGDITFTTSNVAAARNVSVRVIGDTVSRNLVFPAGWTWLGGAAPTVLEANKVAILSIAAFGATDSTIVASWSYDGSDVVTDVTATGPLASSGGATPDISFPSWPANASGALTNDGAGNLSWVEDEGGTVTSVDVSGGTTGLTTSGGPITTSGTITLGGTLNVANGGTGVSSITAGSLVVGDGANAIDEIAPGANGEVLTVVAGAWTSQALPAATDYSVVSITTAVSQGDAVIVDGTAAIATAAASARVAGMVSAAANKVSILGIIEDCNFEGSLTLAVGEAVYLSASSAGKLTNVAPSASGEVVAELGIIVTVNAAGGGAAAADVLWQPKSIVVL